MNSTVESRIICIRSSVMESVVGAVAGVVAGVVVAVCCAFFSGFWKWGEPIQCAFPGRAGFRGAGVVAVQGGKGLRWIEAQQGGGTNGKVCGYAAALSGEAVRLFADSKVGGGRGDAFVAGIKGGEYTGCGVVHRFPSRQHVVDSIVVGDYLPVSSGPGFSFVLSPHCSGLLSLYAPGVGLTFRGVSLSAVVL